MPGNFARWQKPGSRGQHTFGIRTMLVKEGLQPRSPAAIQLKIGALTKQFTEAEQWLKAHGLQDFAANEVEERQVLHLCLHYNELKSVMRDVLFPPSMAQTCSDKPGDGSATESESACATVDQDASPGAKHVQGSVVTQLSGGTAQRASTQARPKGSKRRAKRTRMEELPPCQTETRGAASRSGEPDERRKLFEFELQVKHDQAVCGRALERQKMLRAGIVREEVDRLLPQ
ncbi:hypothetical protein BBJ28_00000960 [Nothophytophthora sp. Chile5]|nr:hypothetical protein BBJ28_00000960 [Nothophytophthora sp. Chile5]